MYYNIKKKHFVLEGGNKDEGRIAEAKEDTANVHICKKMREDVL